MKKVCYLLLACSALFFVSCSRKTHPTVSNTSPTPKTEERPRIPDTMVAAEDSASKVVAPPVALKTFNTPMVVIDASGKIITAREGLPEDIGPKVKYAEIARAYTPVEKNNLIVRFKIVPPRVLFVPNELAQKSAKGTYIIYKKKFWYWKKEDGLFHLDNTYYL